MPNALRITRPSTASRKRGTPRLGPIVERHYPAPHRWVFQQIGPSRGVPRFLLAVDGRVILSAFGTQRYKDQFFPALQEAARRANRS